jgi:hypothetical protein
MHTTKTAIIPRQFWQQHNKPIEISNQEMFAEIVFYIHQNPAAIEFLYEAEQWENASQRFQIQSSS